METKSLLIGIVSFIAGALLVSVAATTLDKKDTAPATMDAMAQDLKGKTGDEYDKLFLDYMIFHHQAAVDMAKLSEGQAKHSEIKQLSGEIISAQEKEIAMMRGWQAEWGYGSAPVHGDH